MRQLSLFTLLLFCSLSLFSHEIDDENNAELQLFCQLKAKTNNFLPGETVHFEARIVNNTNQVVTNVRLIDFAPTGFVIQKSDFIQVGENAILTVKKPIQPGKARIVKFEAHIDEDLIPGLYTNFCKVVYAENERGTAILNDDNEWTSSPWNMAATEALDFVRVLDPVTNPSSSNEKTIVYFKVIQTEYNKEKNQVKIDFSDNDNSSVSYKLYNDSDRLKSTGRIDAEEGLNTLNLDATYLEPGEYLLEMNDGVDSISTRFTIQ